MIEKPLVVFDLGRPVFVAPAAIAAVTGERPPTFVVGPQRGRHALEGFRDILGRRPVPSVSVLADVDLPIGHQREDLPVVPVLPLCHPLGRVAALWQEACARARREGTPEPSAEAYVEAALARERPNGHHVNRVMLHCHKRAAGRSFADADVGRAIDGIRRSMVILLADFPELAAFGLALLAVTAGAEAGALEALRPGAATTLADRVAALRSALPAALTERLLGRLGPDLALFGETAADALESAVAPPAVRREVAAILADAGSSRTRTRARRAQPGFYAGDPALGWVGRPDASLLAEIGSRTVPMSNDAAGMRRIAGASAPPRDGPVVAVFGCSFVFGYGVADDEHLAAELQRLLPDHRIKTFGTNGFCTATSLVQLWQQARLDPPALAVFGWIPQHMERNVADPIVIQRRQALETRSVGTHLKAALTADDALTLHQVPLDRLDLLGIDLSDFGSDPGHRRRIDAALLCEAATIAAGIGARFLVAVLAGALPAATRAALETRASAGATVDILDLDDSDPALWLHPHDPHPSADGHARYAAAIAARVTGAPCAGIAAAPTVAVSATETRG